MYKTFSSGLLGSNTYLVWDEDSRDAMVVDCGNGVRDVRAFAEQNALTVKYIVLTHAHFDHAEYLEEYRAEYPDARVVVHEREVSVMTDPVSNVSAYFATPRSYGYPDMTVREGDVLTLGATEYGVLSTPGHTPGSICLYSAAKKLMLTGDTLFECGRGRTDFKYGSEQDMAASLRRLLSMDGEIVFLPGHGSPSRIGSERGRVF